MASDLWNETAPMCPMVHPGGMVSVSVVTLVGRPHLCIMVEPLFPNSPLLGPAPLLLARNRGGGGCYPDPGPTPGPGCCRRVCGWSPTLGPQGCLRLRRPSTPICLLLAPHTRPH